jgi:hypothetical protein
MICCVKMLGEAIQRSCAKHSQLHSFRASLRSAGRGRNKEESSKPSQIGFRSVGSSFAFILCQVGDVSSADRRCRQGEFFFLLKKKKHYFSFFY